MIITLSKYKHLFVVGMYQLCVLNVYSKEHVLHFSTLHQYVDTAEELGHGFVWISHVSE